MRIIVAISGASGSIYGIEILKALNRLGIETHLVISQAAKMTLDFECEGIEEQLPSLASYYYDDNQLGAPIASGSFVCNAMIIAPCSMKTIAAVANGFTDNLIARSADVMLKEKRKLIICPRETPLNSIHLRNMLTLSDVGAYIVPPMPALYCKPTTIEDMITHHVMKIFDLLELPFENSKRWSGI